MNKCRVCGNKYHNTKYNIKEMLHGTFEDFEYFECNNCGCLQILKYPHNIEKYYPENYLSFKVSEIKSDNFIISYLRKLKAEYQIGLNNNILGFLLSKISKESYEKKLFPANIGFDSKILDVGSGSGRRLISMANKGFNNLTGSDIFIKEDIIYSNGVKILKKDLSKINEKYDFIMLNHTFEHILIIYH